MVHERMQPFLWVSGSRHGLSSAFQDLGEAALLDEREEVFLAADVVVHPCQRHPTRGRKVPHGGGMVALVRKDPGGAGEQVVETLVVWSHEFERLFESEASPRSGRGQGRTNHLISGQDARPSTGVHVTTAGGHRGSSA